MSDEFPLLVEGTRTLKSTGGTSPAVESVLRRDIHAQVKQTLEDVSVKQTLEGKMDSLWVSMMNILVVNQERTTLLKELKDTLAHRLRRHAVDAPRKAQMQEVYLPCTRRIAQFHDPGAFTFESLKRINDDSVR